LAVSTRTFRLISRSTPSSWATRFTCKTACVLDHDRSDAVAFDAPGAGLAASRRSETQYLSPPRPRLTQWSASAPSYLSIGTRTTWRARLRYPYPSKRTCTSEKSHRVLVALGLGRWRQSPSMVIGDLIASWAAIDEMQL
jgi:hypothetical protein